MTTTIGTAFGGKLPIGYRIDGMKAFVELVRVPLWSPPSTITLLLIINCNIVLSPIGTCTRAGER